MAGRRARGQPAAAPGYPAGNGGASTLSAPVPPDHGAGGQQSRGAAAAQAGAFTGQQGGSYGTPVPEADRYAASYGRAARLRAAGRLPGSGGPAGRGAVPGGAAGTTLAQGRRGQRRVRLRRGNGRQARPATSPRPAPTGMTSRGTPATVTPAATVTASAAARGPSPPDTPRRARQAPGRTPRRQAPTATRPTGTEATGYGEQRVPGERVRGQRVPGERVRGQRGRRERLPGG